MSEERTSPTRLKVYAAATALMGERGVAHVSVDDVAAAAGVAKGTIYYNFGSKEKLVERLLHHGGDRLLSQLRPALDRPGSSDVTAALVEAMLTAVRADLSFAQLLVGELWRTPSPWSATLRELREDLIAVVGSVVERLRADRRLDPGVDTRTAAAVLLSAVFAIALDWRVYSPDRSQAEVRDQVVSLLQHTALTEPIRED